MFFVQDGHTFEKAGVNVSVVYGNIPAAAVQQMNARGKKLPEGKYPPFVSFKFLVQMSSFIAECMEQAIYTSVLVLRLRIKKRQLRNKPLLQCINLGTPHDDLTRVTCTRNSSSLVCKFPVIDRYFSSLKNTNLPR